MIDKQALPALPQLVNMPMSFFTLPGELRNKIYNHLLVREEPVDPWDGLHKLAPNILGASKTIYNEAGPLLYSVNCFDLTESNSELIVQFLTNIGSVNAGHLQRICIDLPRIRDLEEEDRVSLEDDSSCILTHIQNHCVNLKTLIMSSSSTNALEKRLDALDSPGVVDKVLALVDARFGALSSLQEVVVELYEDGPDGNGDTRRGMEALGWTMKMVERPEEWDCDRSWGYSEDIDYINDDYDYSYDYDDEDYDIDNDSDFWRRAAD